MTSQSPIRRFHRHLAERGAAIREDAGLAGVPIRFDGPEVEHRRLVESVGVLPETDRRLVRVTGDRALRMVDGLLSNDLSPLERGRAVYGFVLTPRGRPVADLRALPAAEGLWLDVPAAALDGLLAHLDKYLPPLYARHELRPDRARLGLVGPRADAALEAAFPGDAPAPAPLSVAAVSLPRSSREGSPAPEGGPGEPSFPVVRREPEEGEGYDLYPPGDALREVWERLAEAARAVGGGPVGREAREVRRVELGIPAYGAEIHADVLAPETGQADRAISYDKGCYTGQEVVARIHYRGHVNRHLRGIRLEGLGEGAALPEAGARLFREERPVATLGTVARSPRLGPIALAYVRREVEPGETLAGSAGGEGVGRVVGLPFEPPAAGARATGGASEPAGGDGAGGRAEAGKGSGGARGPEGGKATP